MYGNKMKQLKKTALSSARGQLSGQMDKAAAQVEAKAKVSGSQRPARLPLPPSRVQKSPTVSSAPKPNARGPLPIGGATLTSASTTDKKKRLA